MIALPLKGILVGLAIAAPVGPIGALCINRSLKHGFKIGFMTGLGAATADGLYGIIAAFGLTAISSALDACQFWIRLVGGLFLVYMGLHLIRMKEKAQDPENLVQPSAWHAYLTTFFLTLTNPMTLIAFAAVFAGLGLGIANGDYWNACLFIGCVITGSALWWFLLSGFLTFVLHHRISLTSVHRINMISGIAILAFASLAIFSCLTMSSKGHLPILHAIERACQR